MTADQKLTTAAIIISIFNEDKYLKRLLKNIIGFNFFNEIICIDDGSTDTSSKILKSFKNKIQIITFKKNKGKSYAMVAGVKKAQSDIIVFCDADLVKLHKNHFLGLVEPIKYNIADQVLAIREKDVFLFKHLTGERAYRRRDLLPHLEKMEATKFGIETYLNHVFADVRTLWVMTKGLQQAGKKQEKDSIIRYAQAGFEILVEKLREKGWSKIKIIKLLNKKINKINN